MRLALISDVHDNLLNLKKSLDYFDAQNIKKLLCCGDLTNLNTARYLAANFVGEIFIINGNSDNYLLSDLARYPQIHHLGEIGFWTIAKKNIGLCHDPDKIKHLIIKKPNLDYIIYGHTHYPNYYTQNNIKLINPGNLAGLFYPASFAVLDIELPQIELKLLSNL